MKGSLNLGKILEALYSAQAILNPISGFMLKTSPGSKRDRHAEKAREDIRRAITIIKKELNQ